MFSKPNVIIFLRRNNLIIAGRRVSAAKLDLSKEIHFLEVSNPQRFSALLADFLADRDMASKRILVLLDDSIVFHKELPVEGLSHDEIEAAVAAYADAIPFEAGKRACLRIHDGTVIDLYATNGELYSVLRAALRDCGVKRLVAITPSAAYKLDTSIKLSEAIERYLSDKKIQRIGDFSQVTLR